MEKKQAQRDRAAAAAAVKAKAKAKREAEAARVAKRQAQRAGRTGKRAAGSRYKPGVGKQAGARRKNSNLY